MKIIAHRGASSEFPENTLAAFRRAVEIGVDAIETDLVETSDRIILLHHDETLRKVPIDRLTAVEVAKINPMIPSLKDVLAALGSSVSFCLELKTSGLAAQVTELVRKYGVSSKTHITSFQKAEVLEMKKLCPEAAFSWTFLKWPEGAEADFERAGISEVSLSREHLSLATVRHLQKAGIKIRIYTVNETALAAQYEAWGVDAIFTDDPARMQAFRKR